MNPDASTLTRYWAPRFWPTWIGLMLWRALAALPFSVALAIASRFGHTLYYLLGARRRVAEINVGMCLPELASGSRKALVKAHFASLGAALAETGLAWWGSAERVQHIARYEGLEHLDAARRGGGGVILVTGHFTPLDLAGRMLAEAVPGVVGVVRPHANPLLNAVMERGRRRSATVLSKHDTRALVRALKAGAAVWYAPDQHHAGPSSAMIPFFGHPAATSTATSRLCALTGAAVVPYVPRRLPNGEGYLIRFLPALSGFPSGHPAADMQRIHAMLEQWIHDAPEQYLWVHRRFKSATAERPDPYVGC